MLRDRVFVGLHYLEVCGCSEIEVKASCQEAVPREEALAWKLQALSGGGRMGGVGTSPSALLLTCVFAEGSATRGPPPAGRVAVPAGLSASLGPSSPEHSACSPGQACGVGIPQCDMQTSDDSACAAREGGSGLSQQRAERGAGPSLMLPATFAYGQYQLPRGFLLMSRFCIWAGKPRLWP